MSLKTDIQKLNNRLDTCRHKLDSAKSRSDSEMITKFTNDIEGLTKQLKSLKHKEEYELNKERKALTDMAFSREITKAEQADLGKLKKKVKGLVVVLPMTKIGKAMRLDVVTGFAPKPF